MGCGEICGLGLFVICSVCQQQWREIDWKEAAVSSYLNVCDHEALRHLTCCERLHFALWRWLLLVLLQLLYLLLQHPALLLLLRC